MDDGDAGDTGVARRDIIQAVSAAMLGAVAQPAFAAAPARSAPAPAADRYPGRDPVIAMLIYPGMVMIDLIGPLTVFNILGCDIRLVWKDKQPVQTELRIPVTPTTSFADCPADLDVLFIPGGTGGTIACMNDPEVLAFVADHGARAKYVTSVCTGSMVLAAAGLLRGYKATTLWPLMPYLPILGAKPIWERVVVDRNRITGGGATAGIDFGLALGAVLRGQREAERAQLIIEYAPNPPFNAGTPHTAAKSLVDDVKAGRAAIDGNVEAAARRIASSWIKE